MRILAADDYEANLSLYTQMCHMLGPHEIRCAKHGKQAWEMFSKDPDSWDLLLVDLNMPTLSGDEFIQKVREMGSSVPVIVVTALQDRNLAGLQIFNVLQKPVQMQPFEEAISQVEEFLNPSSEPPPFYN